MGYLAAKLGKDQPTDAEKDRIILALRDAILGRCSPSSIVIFGSILGSAFTRASDIDCAVIFSDQSALATGRKRLYGPPALINLPYDLLLYDRDDFMRRASDGGVCQVINETGRVIYDEKPKV